MLEIIRFCFQICLNPVTVSTFTTCIGSVGLMCHSCLGGAVGITLLKVSLTRGMGKFESRSWNVGCQLNGEGKSSKAFDMVGRGHIKRVTSFPVMLCKVLWEGLEEEGRGYSCATFCLS